MKLTKKRLVDIIRECAGEALGDLRGSPAMGSIKIIKLGAVPPQEEISAGLFPGMHHSHEDSEDMRGNEHMHDGDEAIDDEGGGVIGKIVRLAGKTDELRHMADRVPEHEQWIHEKVAVASAMIDSIHSYLKNNKERQ